MQRALPFIISGTVTAIVLVTISFFVEDDSQAKGTLVSGLIAAIVICAIPIYDIDRWSLLKRSFVHFILMAMTVLPLLLYSEWYSPIVSIGVFILFGSVGWTIGFVVNKFQNKKSTH